MGYKETIKRETKPKSERNKSETWPSNGKKMGMIHREKGKETCRDIER